MTDRYKEQRINVILEPKRKRQLERLAREATYRYDRDVTLSDIVRHALHEFLDEADERTLRRIAEEKTEYETKRETS